MKAKIRFEDFGGKVEIQHGEVVISSKEEDDFSISMEEFTVPGIKEIEVFPRRLNFEIEQEDGWIIEIKRGSHEKEYLVITRFKRPVVGGTLLEEYLTKDEKWLPVPSGLGPYPSDIMKIPIPALELEKAQI